MKKIVVLSVFLSMIILVPQIAFAQTEEAPAKQEIKAAKQEGAKKEMKEKALPVKTEEASGNTAKDINKPTETAKGAKKGEQQEMKNEPGFSKSKPREAIITPLKNPKNNKVVVGKKIDKKPKDEKLRIEKKEK